MNFDDMEDELKILEEMKALYHKNIIRKPVEKRSRRNLFKDVPDHLLDEILVKVASKDLFKNAILVCHKWMRVISSSDFKARIFLSERDKLLIGTRKGFYKYDLFTVKELEMSEQQQQQLECKLHGFGLSSRMGRVRSSCNGLMIVHHPIEKGVLKVMNPTTRVCLTLPKCPSDCPHKTSESVFGFDPISQQYRVMHRPYKACGLALGFDPISKVYKVVHIYTDAFGFEIADLTSSELTWRRIPGPWEALFDRPFNIHDFSWHDPVSVNNGRYLHWFVDSNQYIISFDISREISTRTYLPYLGQNVDETHRYNLVELGGCLAFMHVSSDRQLDVWILEDVTNHSWSKKHSIMTELVNYVVSENPAGRRSRPFENALPKMNKLVPVASLNDGKVLVLKHDSFLYLYDMGSRVMKKFKMTIKKDMFFILHRSSSLLHWN